MDGQSSRCTHCFSAVSLRLFLSFMREGKGHPGVVHSYRNSSDLFARAVLLSSDWCLAEALPPRQVL